MRRLAAALAALALAGALVFPSAAAPFALSQSDAITQDVALSPADSPNGDYAYLDGDDELVVDLTAANPNRDPDAEGINDDGVTRISNVFEIRYDGSRHAHVWITHESEHVTLVARGDPIQSESNNVTLGPNESVAVGLVVDTTGETPDGLIDGMEVHASVAEPEGIDSADDGDGSGVPSAGSGETAGSGGGSAGETDPGSAVQQFSAGPGRRSVTVLDPPTVGPITVDLDGMPLDVGADGGDLNLTLEEIDVTAANDSVVSLDLSAAEPGGGGTVGVERLGAVTVTEAESGSVSTATLRFGVSRASLDDRGIAPADLTVTRDGDGETSTLPVRVVGERDDRVVFEVDTPGFSTFTVAALRPSIAVDEATLSTASIESDGSATVTARVSNDGRTAGTRTVVLAVDGKAIAERTVDLAAGESTAVTFEVAPGEAGEHAVAVDDASAGTLSVSAASGTDEESTTDASGGGPTEADVDGDGSDPVEEPAGLGLPEVAGLAALLALLTAVSALVRRAPR